MNCETAKAGSLKIACTVPLNSFMVNTLFIQPLIFLIYSSFTFNKKTKQILFIDKLNWKFTHSKIPSDVHNGPLYSKIPSYVHNEPLYSKISSDVHNGPLYCKIPSDVHNGPLYSKIGGLCSTSQYIVRN